MRKDLPLDEGERTIVVIAVPLPLPKAVSKAKI
jgi:hypothetical protein